MKTQHTNRSFIPKAVALANSLNSDDSNTGWLKDYRQAQIALLENSVFPHKQVEHFKYNRLNDFDSDNAGHDFNQLAEVLEADRPNSKSYFIEGLSETTEQIIFINGVISSLSVWSKNSRHKITAIDDATEAQQAKILALLNSQDTAKNIFTQYNASLTGVNNNAVLIEIDETSPADVIEIIHINTEATAHKSVNAQVFVDIAERCKACIIERSVLADDLAQTKATTLSTTRTLINIADNANCTHYNLALQNSDSIHFASIGYNLGSHSTLTAFHTATGSKLNKIDVEANHLGQHAHANINGLYVATDDEQVDYHTTVSHPLPHGTTDENFRGIVNGNAEATFNGRIHIFEDAQKTLAELSNKNLLLSDDAILHTKPELEIYADDVVCAHGATVSRLNNDSLSYLQARGIAKAEGEKMLSYAFFDELLAELDIEAVADYLRPILFAKFK